jgi:hypothetical protein
MTIKAARVVLLMAITPLRMVSSSMRAMAYQRRIGLRNTEFLVEFLRDHSTRQIYPGSLYHSIE